MKRALLQTTNPTWKSAPFLAVSFSLPALIVSPFTLKQALALSRVTEVLALEPLVTIPFAPEFRAGGHTPHEGEVHILPVDQEIVREMLDMQISIKLGEETNALKGHWMLAKLKVAALLSILHGSTSVTIPWWDGAQRVMEHSDATRDMLIETLQRAANRENIARGKGDAERLIAATTTIVQRTASRVVEMLREANGESVTKSAIKQRLSKPMRENLDAALHMLAKDGRAAQVSAPPIAHRKGTAEKWKLLVE